MLERNERRIAFARWCHVFGSGSSGVTAVLLSFSQHPIARGSGDASSDSFIVDDVRRALKALQFLQSAVATTQAGGLCEAQLCFKVPPAKLRANPGGCRFSVSWTSLLWKRHHHLSISFVEGVAVQNLMNFAHYVVRISVGLVDARAPFGKQATSLVLICAGN